MKDLWIEQYERLKDELNREPDTKEVMDACRSRIENIIEDSRTPEEKRLIEENAKYRNACVFSAAILRKAIKENRDLEHLQLAVHDALDLLADVIPKNQKR